MYAVYVLLSLKDKRTYVGYSNNIERRLKEHNTGFVRATRNRTPLKLLFSEEFETMQAAKTRELFWKSGAGRRKLKEYFKTYE